MQKSNFQKYIDIYYPIMKAMHELLGERSEFILHDVSRLESSVVAVCGNVTSRPIGAPCTNLIIETLTKQGDQAEDILGYRSVAKDGRVMKSTTIFIRDNGKIVGCMCCNVDLTEYMAAESLLRQFCQFNEPKEEKHNKEVFAQEISEVVEDIIRFELQAIDKPVPHMSREDRLALVEVLETKGVFYVKGAVETLARHLGVSTYTVYNYIKDVRNNNKTD